MHLIYDCPMPVLQCLENASVVRMEVMWAQHRDWGQKPASETEGRGPGSRVGTETPILWPPDAESWLTGKDLEAGKD